MGSDRWFDNVHPALRKCWHPVAWASEMPGDGPIAVELMGEHWCVARLDGVLTAVRDECPHRLSPLSAGTIVDGTLQCAYHGYRFDANQELLAIGAGNIGAGLGRGFPVSGGMSQSLVNESAGARTPLSGLVAALFTLMVVLFASGLLRNPPQPVLAAIVLAAVMSLFSISALRHIWHFSRAAASRTF